MKIIDCPINGPRPAQEFHYGGEFRMPDAESSDEEWGEYVFYRSGQPGIKREWWYHVPSGTWFIAERDNRTDEFQRTYLFDGKQDYNTTPREMNPQSPNDADSAAGSDHE